MEKIIVRFDTINNLEIMEYEGVPHKFLIGDNFINFISLNLENTLNYEIIKNLNAHNYKSVFEKITAYFEDNVKIVPEIIMNKTFLQLVNKQNYTIKENSFIEDLKKDLKDVLDTYNQYKNLIEYCYFGENSNTMTPLQNFIYYLHINNIDEVAIPNVTINRFGVEPKEKNGKINKSENIAKMIKENSPFLYYYYQFTSIEEYMRIAFIKLIENNYKVYKCKNCGKYFIPYQREDTYYCKRKSPQDDTKTCSEFGIMKAWRDKANDDGWYNIYRKIYSKKATRVNRAKNESPDTLKYYEDNFEKFKDEAKSWKKAIKNGEKSEKEFIDWLEKNRN